MVRPAKPRYVSDEPRFTYFKPKGIPLRELQEERLSVEELEALKLIDIEGLYQEEAAARMEVSRPTFHRILKEARTKVTRCLVEGKALGIEGGNYILSGDTRIFECFSCGHQWGEPFGTGIRACESTCPECGQRTVRRADGKGQHGGGAPGGARRCGNTGDKTRTTTLAGGSDQIEDE